MRKRSLLIKFIFSFVGSLLVSISTISLGADIEHFTLPENRPKNLPFSEAVRVGNTVYLSGQIAIPPGESELVSGGIGPESRQTLTNIGLVLQHFSLDFRDIIKCQVMLANISEWPSFNAVYKEFIPSPYPARSAFAGSGLAFDARVEVECVAVIPADKQAANQCLEKFRYCSSVPYCEGLECRPGSSRARVPKCLPPLDFD